MVKPLVFSKKSNITAFLTLILILTLVTGCGLSFNLNTTVNVSDSNLQDYLEAIERFQLNAKSELYSGAHRLGKGEDQCIVLVPGTDFKELPLPAGVTTSIHLIDVDVNIDDKDKIELAKSSGTFEVRNVPNVTVPIVIKANIKYKGVQIPLAIPISKVSWQKGGSVSVEPVLIKIPVDVKDTGWSENDDRLPKDPASVAKICSSIQNSAANFAQHIATRLTDSIQGREGVEALVSAHANRNNLLWKTIEIEKALFTFRENSELKVNESSIHFAKSENGKSILALEHLKFDNNYDFSGKFRTAINLGNKTKFLAADSMTVCDSGKIDVDLNITRKKNTISLQMSENDTNAISLRNCVQNIGNPAHTVTEIESIDASIRFLDIERNTKEHKSRVKTTIKITLKKGIIDIAFKNGELNSELREAFPVIVNVESNESAGSLSCESEAGLKLKDISISFVDKDKKAKIQISEFDTEKIFVNKTFNGMIFKTNDLSFRPVSVELTSNKNQNMLKFNPNTSWLRTKSALEFDTSKDSQAQIPDLDFEFESPHGYISSEKFKLTLSSLKGNLNFRPHETVVVNGIMSLVAKGCPEELQPSLSANDVEINCDNVSYQITKDGINGSFPSTVISMPERKAFHLLKSHIPQSFEIPADILLKDKLLHVWDLKTRDGGYVDKISSSLKGSFGSDSKFHISDFGPVVYLKTKCKYKHCRWLKCHEREQLWDIDTAWHTGGTFKIDLLAGDSLATSELQIQAEKITSTTFDVLRLEGMNNAIKAAIKTLSAFSFWLPIDDALEKGIGTKKFPLLKNENPESVLHKFKLGGVSFSLVNGQLQWTINDLYFSL